MKRLTVFALVAVCLAALGVPAMAQDTVEPSGAQQDYNDKGVIAMQQGKFGEAVASFRSSLSLGELNVTHLNLGRAYFRMGQCLDARESYDAARSSPKVSAPTPAEIDELLTRFDKEWVEECNARLQLECEGDPKVTIGDTLPRSCSTVAAWPVVPGPVTVKYRYGTENFEKKVTVAKGETATVALSMTVEAPDEDPVTEPGVVADSGSGSSLGTIGWIVGGVGVALVGGAFIYDIAVTGPALDELDGLPDTRTGREDAVVLRDEINNHQTTSIILGGVGAAALIGGVVLVLLDEDEAPAVSGWADETGGGIAFGGTW